MNHIKILIYTVLLILALGVPLPVVFVFNEVAVSVGDFQVKEGDEVEVSIEILNSMDIAGGYVKIEYDKSILDVADVKGGDFSSPILRIEKDKGLISIAVASPSAIGKSKGTLAVIKFTALSSGTSLLRINYAELNNERGEIIIPKLINGRITVQEKESIVTVTLMQTFVSTVTVTHTRVLTITQTITQKISSEISDILSGILPYILLIAAIAIFLVVLKIYKS